MRWTEGVARNLLQEPASAASSSTTGMSPSRKATEEQLRATEDRYSHLFYSAADIIFEADAEGYFRFVNPQTLKVFEFGAGRSGRPALHRVHSRRLPAADPAALLPADQHGPAQLVCRVSGHHQVGQRSVARPERLDHHR